MTKDLSYLNKESLLSIEAVFFDFDGVFTDNFVYFSEDGLETIKSSRSDGLGIARLHELGIKTKIISTEKNEVVARRAEKLKIECSDGVSDKALEIRLFCKENNIELKNVIFVGNDINDINALNIVGFPIGVLDSYPEIIPHIKYKTSKPGGHGAVREVCDLIFNAHVNLN